MRGRIGRVRAQEIIRNVLIVLDTITLKQIILQWIIVARFLRMSKPRSVILLTMAISVFYENEWRLITCTVSRFKTVEISELILYRLNEPRSLTETINKLYENIKNIYIEKVFIREYITIL